MYGASATDATIFLGDAFAFAYDAVADFFITALEAGTCSANTFFEGEGFAICGVSPVGVSHV